MTRPTPIGRAALEPQPMTPDQIADLVDRSRRNSTTIRADRARVASAAAVVARRWSSSERRWTL